MNTQALPTSGGVCGVHNQVYVGRRCPVCAITAARVLLRQGVWEASQFMDEDRLVDYVRRVLAEIASDAP